MNVYVCKKRSWKLAASNSLDSKFLLFTNNFFNMQEKKVYLENPDEDYVFTPYITRNGVRVYHPTGGVYKIPIRKPK